MPGPAASRARSKAVLDSPGFGARRRLRPPACSPRRSPRSHCAAPRYGHRVGGVSPLSPLTDGHGRSLRAGPYGRKRNRPPARNGPRPGPHSAWDPRERAADRGDARPIGASDSGRERREVRGEQLDLQAAAARRDADRGVDTPSRPGPYAAACAGPAGKCRRAHSPWCARRRRVGHRGPLAAHRRGQRLQVEASPRRYDGDGQPPSTSATSVLKTCSAETPSASAASSPYEEAAGSRSYEWN